MKNNLRIMFMGTPDIAVPFLKSVNEEYEVVCVVTQPDKPKGRGHKISRCAVAECADNLNIDVLQPVSFKEFAFLPELEKYKPDVIVVVAYGRLLPKYVLDYPKYGCINVHASLLPELRGACPINRAIMNGEKVSGVTTMLMGEGLDTGDMLLKQEIPISDEMTAGELHDEICIKCPPLLIETLKNIKTIVPIKQQDDIATYTGMLTKENTMIDWSRNATDIVNFIRGLNPFPTAYSTYMGKRLKIYKAKLCKKCGNPGEILSCDSTLIVGCGDYSVEIMELQLESKKRMSSEDLLRGYKMIVGEVLK